MPHNYIWTSETIVRLDYLSVAWFWWYFCVNAFEIARKRKIKRTTVMQSLMHVKLYPMNEGNNSTSRMDTEEDNGLVRWAKQKALVVCDTRNFKTCRASYFWPNNLQEKVREIKQNRR